MFKALKAYLQKRKEQRDLNKMLQDMTHGEWPFNFRKEDIRVRNEWDKDTLNPQVRFTHAPTGVEVIRKGDLLQTLGDTSRLVVWMDMHDRINEYVQKGGRRDGEG